MPRGRLSRFAVLAAVLAVLLAASAANGALVIVNDIVLHADGSYHPQKLPRKRFVPIHFQGYFDIAARGGGKPVALEEAVVDFDRDGRLSVGGLPTCSPQEIENASTAAARRTCGDAVVGSGRIEAALGVPAGTIPVSAPLTLFNGPRQAGNPTVILHAQFTFPATQTYAVVIPIERRRGEFRYRATLELPPLADGLASITRVEVSVGRRFGSAGESRSYVSAHCSDGILRTHGRFVFADGTIVDGAVEKACTPR